MRIRPNTALNVAVLGYGVVGRMVAQQLVQQRNPRLVLHTVCERAANPLSMPAKVRLTNHYQDVVNNPAIDVVVEAFGGTSTAFDAVHTALCNGKQVMTANTALLAAYGKSLFETARIQNVSLGCEGALGGGMGMARWLGQQSAPESLTLQMDDAANRVFTRMETSAESMSQTQARLGEQTAAEMTLAGRELLFKAAIVKALTWGTWSDIKRLHPQGVDQVTPELIRMAIKMGYRVRLVAHITADELTVGPQLVPQSSQFAQPQGIQMTVQSAHGHFQMQGAQPVATAAVSGIMQDLTASMAGQPAVQVPQHAGTNVAVAAQAAQKFMVTLPSGLAAKLRGDARLSLMVEETDTRTEQVGAVFQTPLPASEIRQAVGVEAFMLPLMTATQDKREGLRF